MIYKYKIEHLEYTETDESEREMANPYCRDTKLLPSDDEFIALNSAAEKYHLSFL